MKKFKWLLGILLLELVPMLQSCDDDGYSIGDFSWDWATVRESSIRLPLLYLGSNLWMVNVWYPFSILWLT